jgi:hypothetical protein
MPALVELLAKRAGVALEILQDTTIISEQDGSDGTATLAKRIDIPYNDSSPAGLIEANTVDPWRDSGKYALGWVYFCAILLVLTILFRLYHLWSDKIRTAIHKDELLNSGSTASPDTDYELSALGTDKSTTKFFPRDGALPQPPNPEPSISPQSHIMNCAIAFCRYVAYYPLPNIRLTKRWRPVVLPPLGVLFVVVPALIFTVLYCFVPQPLYWQSIRFGSPPLAIRAGMIAVAMMPWIVALSMKANFIALLTGIGHERLNVLHRWLAYLCLLMSLIHTVPFYVQPVWEHGGLDVFQSYFGNTGRVIYGTGMFYSSMLHIMTLIANRYRCAGSSGCAVCTFASTTTTPLLRSLRHCTRPYLDRVPRYALLALQQLPHFLVLPLGYTCNLAIVLRCAPLLSQLDKSLAYVPARWRGSCSHCAP